MHTLQRLFSPDGQKFYKLFDEVAENLTRMSELFYQAICKPEKPISEYYSSLDALEQANDRVTQKLFLELGRNFITPFDREDIHYISGGLDDIADLLFGTIRQMRSYELDNPGNTTQYVAGEIKHFTQILSKALKGLEDKRNLTKLQPLCFEMEKIIIVCESRIDAAIAGIFPNNNEVVAIIKWIEHFELLRILIKKCDNVVNIIEAIAIKYG
ncbi:MAG: DUF47 family protein [Bacteroidetes bacterium]|nr:DUF47 family protein [Bacteroidota bacterium]